jgi:hypothetical protein
MTQHSLSPKLERDRSRHDTRRVEQAAWASWYRLPIWKSIRRHRLAEEPQCRECAIEGRTVAVGHVDHVEPHRGDWSLAESAYGGQLLTLSGPQDACPFHLRGPGQLTYPSADCRRGTMSLAIWTWSASSFWLNVCRPHFYQSLTTSRVAGHCRVERHEPAPSFVADKKGGAQGEQV